MGIARLENDNDDDGGVISLWVVIKRQAVTVITVENESGC